MSSKKVEIYSLRSISLLALLMMSLLVFSCKDRAYERYPSVNNNYNAPQPSYAPAQAPVRQQQYQQQNPYGNQYQPYYYGAPNSRSYYNPYEFQQPYGGRGNPYPDYDQYYVPPVQYYNNETPGGQGPSKESVFSEKS